MTSSEEELTRDENIDQRVLVEHIKDDLFPKAMFFQARMNGMWVE
jgi:hypothetical protein